MRTSRKKRPPQEWHAANGELARQINELLQKLIAETKNRYGRAAVEGRMIEKVTKLFLDWRCILENKQYREIQDLHQRSFWLGPADKFK